MKRVVVVLGTALILGAQPATELSAQLWEAGLPGQDVASIVVYSGALVPTTELPDGSTHETGVAVGGSVTWWVHRYLGFRGHVTRSVTEGVHGDVFSAAAANASSVWLYGGEVALRYPILGDRVAPFVSAGPAGKSYRWKYGMYGGGTSFAWSGAAGVDIRATQSGRFGLILEGRYHRSKYLWHGFRMQGPLPDFEVTAPTMNDFVFDAGVSVNF